MPPLHHKKNSFRRQLSTILLHTGLWFMYAFVQLMASKIEWSQLASYSITTATLLANSAVVFYLNSELLLPRTLEKGNRTLWIGGLVFLFVYNWFMRYLYVMNIFPIVNGVKYPYDHLTFLLNNIWWWFQAVAFSTGYWFAKVSIKRERMMHLQREEINRKKNEQMILQKEKLELEVAYLRAQINPHFLFNTLGYFYNKTANSHPDVAEGIAALTNIMRSSLKKRGPDGMVFLEEEVEHIESLISIYLMRFNNGIYVEYERPDSVSGYRILPHILITLVENAFKHGELHNVHHPLKIKLELTDTGLDFYIHNKKRIGPKEISNGIGMEYVQRQLDNTYKNNYSFDISDTDLYYSLSLHITTTEITVHDQLLYN